MQDDDVPRTGRGDRLDSAPPVDWFTRRHATLGTGLSTIEVDSEAGASMPGSRCATILGGKPGDLAMDHRFKAQRSGRDGRRPGRRIGGVFFDQPVRGPTIVFAPRRPPSEDGPARLWWTPAATPELIEQVGEALAARPKSVDAIVIGELARYPWSLREWPKWLARWSRRPEMIEVIVETDGLDQRARHQLIERTRRQAALHHHSCDPVARAAAAIRDWMTGRTP